MKEIDNTPIESFDQDWGDPDGTGKKAKSLEQVQAFLKKHMNNGYKYISTATPSTTPITLTGDEKVFYIATEEGDYTNFGLGNISELSIIKSDSGTWVVEELGIPMNIKVTINNKVDKSLDLRNILNPDWIHWGGIWQNNSYRAIGNTYGYTDLIPCAYPNKLIAYKALADGSNVTFSVYDSNGTYLRQIKASDSDNGTALFTSQEGDYFIRINLNGGSTYQNHANYGETLNEYTPYNGNPIFGYLQDFADGYLQDFVGITPKIKYSISSFISSVICIGDSMTAGVIGTMGTFNNYSYPTYLSRITGWTIENTGTGGQTPRGWWSGKFPNYTYTDYEIAIIYLGQNEGLTETLDADTFDGTAWAANTTYAVNDIVLYNKIGRKCIEAHTSGETFDDSKWSNAYTNYADTNTGCYCKIIEGMLIQNPLLKIFLLCGTAASSWEGASRGRVISQISERYALPVFNIKNNTWINLLNTSYHPYNDNIHYGPMGYNALARVIYAYLMKHFTDHEYEFNTWPLE